MLQRTRAHEASAWERLVSLYSPLVYRWCRKAGLQPADAADVGQEVFRAVARKIGDFEQHRPGATFRGWLRTITQNKLRDRRRKKAAEAVGGSDNLEELRELPDEAAVRPDPPADAEEEGLVYRRALELIRSEFEERTWQAFWSVVVDGRRPADVAADLGLTVNAVYLAKSRVLRRIRDEFENLIDTRTQ